MDKFTRKDMKTDRFAEQVQHSLRFVTSHSRQTLLYSGGALLLILVSAVAYYVRQSQQTTRQQTLVSALRIHEGVVGPAAGPGDPSATFPTKEAKEQAQAKAFQDVISKHAGSNEASVAAYHLGAIAADAGKMDEAEKHFKTAAASGGKDYASTANFSLAQLYVFSGKSNEAEKILRALVDSPTTLVSKEQATIALARVLAKSKPAEAKKLLDPLQKDKNPVIARNALAAYGELGLQ
ncbi:MAG: tetratricopeptide repeat protein [Acidobacteriia bacterium]|nr:tetratricopeptide repeat protein [Terriglobia bacterium]